MSFNVKCPFHVFMAGILSSTVIFAVTTAVLFTRRPAIKRFDVDARFSNSIRHGNTVYISGQVGEGNTIEEQTLAALAAVDVALAQAGTNKSKVLEVTVWLSDISSDYKGMNTVYDNWIAKGTPPCRACVEAKLYAPECKVEFRVVAAV